MYLLARETNALGGKLGSPHCLDLPFVFGWPDIPFAGTGPHRAELTRQMRGAWAAFARTGKPDHASLPPWPPYEAGDRATMIFDVDPKVVGDPDREQRLAQLALLG